MLLYKKNIFFKYKSLLSVLSFNHRSSSNYIWNIRKNILYLFFTLYKKTFFIKIFLNFFFLIYCYKLKKKINLKLKNKEVFLLYTNYFLRLYNYNYHFIFYRFLLSNHQKSFNCLGSYKTYNIYLNLVSFHSNHLFFFSFLYDLFYIYNNYTFLLFMWLYSIKITSFYNVNSNCLPYKEKKFVILKSPHTNKKAREKFHIKKIKKTLIYPSILNTTFNFLFTNFINENTLIKNQHYNKYF